MLKKIKAFFIKILPSRRKIIQLYAALLYNAHLKGFISGEIFKGKSKSVCLPGLNCYSCPGAIGACPLGSIQNALAESKTKLPFYVLGIILLYCIMFGRTICGFLCPVGLMQELLYKIKSPKVRKSKITRCLSYFKYILLVVLVIGLPLIYGLQNNGLPVPGFCKYICPAGTFEGAIFLLANKNNADFFGMLGSLFTWKFVLLMIFIIASIFIFRFFCRFLCPLGAIYGIFNKISILGVKVEKDKCTSCNVCINKCKMDVLEVGDHECIQCGECMKSCPANAIKWKMITKIVKDELEEERSNESVNKKKIRKISKKTFGIIVNVVALVVLIITLIGINCKKDIYKIGTTCTNLNITYVNELTFDINTDSNNTIIYFENNLSQDSINELDEKLSSIVSKENLTIIIVTSYDNSNSYQLPEYMNLAKDTKKNKLLKCFTKDINDSHFIFMDKDDTILISKADMINEKDLNATIIPTVLGKKVGVNVGDICISQDIQLINSDKTFSVLDNRGKITIINFWFDGCGPCIAELPHFNSLYEEYKDDVEVIAIHAAGATFTLEKATNFVNLYFKDFSIMFGFDNADSQYYEIFGGTGSFPLTVIVDKEGVITYNMTDPLSEEQLRSLIEEAL